MTQGEREFPKGGNKKVAPPTFPREKCTKLFWRTTSIREKRIKFL
jgi:hypothetical protein